MQASQVSVSEKGTYTYDDYAKLPEGAPYELIRGHLVHEPSPATRHQRLAARLTQRFLNHVDVEGEGDVLPAMDVRLTDTNVFQPDVSYVSEARRDRFQPQYVDGAPDLVVEILSPSTKRYDLQEKRETYARHGVREYWIVDPEAETVEVQVNAEGESETRTVAREGDTVTSTAAGGLTLDVSALFQSTR